MYLILIIEYINYYFILTIFKYIFNYPTHNLQ